MPNESNAPRRGETFYGPTMTIPASTAWAGSSIALEGVAGKFIDSAVSTPTTRRSGRKVCAILVRNTSGITLIGGLATTWASGYIGRRVDGYSCVTAAKVAGIVDPWYGTNGVRNGDLFWLILRGPCEVHTPVAGSSFGGGDWAVDDILYALTAAASTATTTGATTSNEGGRLCKWATDFSCSVTAATDGSLAKVLANRVGRVISAATTHNTAASTLKLIDLNIQLW